MNGIDMLNEALGRKPDIATAVLQDITPDQLTARLDSDANSIAWLIWHAARIEDSMVSSVSGEEEVYTAEGWAGRFGLPFDDKATGYGFTSADVAAVRGSAELLQGYITAVEENTLRFVKTQTDADLDRIVDPDYNPPVTAGERLASVLEDVFQHLGQAAYAKGILQRISAAPAVPDPTTAVISTRSPQSPWMTGEMSM